MPWEPKPTGGAGGGLEPPNGGFARGLSNGGAVDGVDEREQRVGCEGVGDAGRHL